MTLRKKIFIPLIASLVLSISPTVFAGDPPPVGGDPTGTLENAIGSGGSAPIGSGLALIIGLGLAYGTKKTYQLTKEEE